MPSVACHCLIVSPLSVSDGKYEYALYHLLSDYAPRPHRRRSQRGQTQQWAFCPRPKQEVLGRNPDSSFSLPWLDLALILPFVPHSVSPDKPLWQGDMCGLRALLEAATRPVRQCQDRK